MPLPTVLLPATHRAISSSLARFGYEVLTASDKTEALALLRASRCITVLVADVDAGGLTLAREARAIRPNLSPVKNSRATDGVRVLSFHKYSGLPV